MVGANRMGDYLPLEPDEELELELIWKDIDALNERLDSMGDGNCIIAFEVGGAV